MRKERIILGLILVVFLLLESPVAFLWSRIGALEERLDQMEMQSIEARQETLEAIPETTEYLPEETTLPETLPLETEPPKVTIDQVPHYYQNDYPNEPYGTGTVATGGSNMAALAMVATYLTDHEYYPDQMADYLAHFDGGHYQRLEYGSDLLQLSWKRAANIHEALAGVRDGKVAIFMQDKNSIFSWKDHYIVVTGVNENGKYNVLDPDREHYDLIPLQNAFQVGFSQGDLLIGYTCAWLYDKSAMPEEPFIYEPEPAAAESRYGDMLLTNEEKYLMAKLIYMEAGGEPFEGQQAVAEVILNRLASGRFQSTIHNIIYAPDQFAAVPYLDKAEPDYTQLKAIEQAQYGPYVLPEDVVFYAKFKVNDNVWGKIGEHYFCYSY